MKVKCIKNDPLASMEVGHVYECEKDGDNFIIRGTVSIISSEQFNELFELYDSDLEFEIFKIASMKYCLNEGEWGYQKFRDGFIEGIKYANKINSKPQT